MNGTDNVKRLIAELDRVSTALADAVHDLRELAWELVGNDQVDVGWRLRTISGEVQWALRRLNAADAIRATVS